MSTPVIDRLLSRVTVDPNSNCWRWNGSVTHGGYGRIKVTTSQAAYVHRVTYEALVGPIPCGMELDHLCRVRSCVNPEHLEPVTRTVNNQRAHSYHSAKTSCPQGHPYDEENTLTSGGKRHCRACRRRKAAERRQRPDVKAYQAAKAREYRSRKSEVDIHGERVTA